MESGTKIPLNSINNVMLQSLSIRDFILIEKLDLDFEDGFCVITGQTGAGKSILLDAILFALGAKAGGEVVRANQEKAIVTLSFSTSDQITRYLFEYDIKIETDEELIIKRIQYASGRKKFFINDHIISQKVIYDLFDYLLEVHGQHNHTSLLNISSYIDILDKFVNDLKLRDEVATLYKEWQILNNEISVINADRENITKEIEYLSYIFHEYEVLDIKDGEEEELAQIKKYLQTRDKEIKLINSILHDIQTSSIEQIIAKSQRNISKSENTEIYDKINNYLEEAYNKIDETKSALDEALSNFGLSEHNISDIEDRLYAIRDLARKHGCTVSEIGNFMQNSKEKLNLLESKLKNSVNLSEKMENVRKKYFEKAGILSQNRQIRAKELEVKTMNELAVLDMQKAVFQVQITSEEEAASSKGIDKVRFFVSTNPGMPSAPIDQIASGGELSRFMLGFRGALFDKGSKQTIIFDEIDVGISGSVADAIGQRLKSLSEVAQVIVITHQPQVAGKARQHILVQKKQTDIATTVTIETLNLEGRAYEIARMISGKEITDKSLAAAKELICI